MKILLASSSSGSHGGGELFLNYLGHGLARRGHDVWLWASTHHRMDELCGAFATFGTVVRSHYRNTYDYRSRPLATCFNVAASHRIAQQWGGIKPDVVHVNKQNLEDGLDLLRAAKATGTPSVCTVHITQCARFLKARVASIRDRVARRALRAYPGRYVAVGDLRKVELEAIVGGTVRVSMIYNGVPAPDLNQLDSHRAAKRRELGISEGQCLIVGVGRMVGQKRPMLFLEHAAAVHAIHPHARFLWVGDGELSAEWDQWVNARGLRSIIGRLPWQTEVLPVLAAADLFLHMAAFEGLPLALLEAMSVGLPSIVTSELAQQIHLFRSEDNVIVGDDPETLVQAIASPTRLREIGQNARRVIEDKASLDHMAAKYEALYRDTISAHA